LIRTTPTFALLAALMLTACDERSSTVSAANSMPAPVANSCLNAGGEACVNCATPLLPVSAI